MLIGKLLLLVWLSLTPEEQISRVVAMSQEFCEQQSCSLVMMEISESDKDVYFFANCIKWYL